MKLIICTTAITRGDFHHQTIGKLYKQYDDTFRKYEVFHIINIDSPPQLTTNYTYTSNETEKIFEQIIPRYVNKIFIKTETPGFCNAYINILRKIKECNLVTSNSIVWWLEDDWQAKENTISFLKFNNFLKLENSSMTITEGSPFGSFRGGPIMSASYFENMFDIHNKGINPLKDPEMQVGKWGGGVDRGIIRDLSHPDNNVLYLVCIYVLSHYDGLINLCAMTPWYYKKRRNTRFHKNMKLKYVVGLINGGNSKKIYSFKTFEYGKSYSIDEAKSKSEYISISEFKKPLKNYSIKYIALVPFIMTDKGREFNKKHQLQKWSEVEHNTTYV